VNKNNHLDFRPNAFDTKEMFITVMTRLNEKNLGTQYVLVSLEIVPIVIKCGFQRYTACLYAAFHKLIVGESAVCRFFTLKYKSCSVKVIDGVQ